LGKESLMKNPVWNHEEQNRKEQAQIEIKDYIIHQTNAKNTQGME